MLKSLPPPPPTTPLDLVWPSRPVVILSYFASHEVLITFFTGLHTQHSTHKDTSWKCTRMKVVWTLERILVSATVVAQCAKILKNVQFREGNRHTICLKKG